VKSRTSVVAFGLCCLVAFCAARADAQTYSVLHNFPFPAEVPMAPLAQGPDNMLYGTASEGGAANSGAVFKVKPDGSGFTNIYSFEGGLDGAAPIGGLVLAGGTLFGTTSGGGVNDNGTIFALDTNGGGFNVLWTFSETNADTETNADGANPNSGLVLSGGALFGTALNGGANANGTVFTLNTNGSGFNVLSAFSPGDYNTGDIWTNSDGANPYAGLLLSGTNLFGTTYDGGANGYGTVFRLGTNGVGFAVLKIFLATNTLRANVGGANPYTGLILSGGTLFGTAEQGGSGGNGTVFALGTNGSGFTVLTNLTASKGNADGVPTNADGAYPDGALILAGSFLFGTAYAGGAYGNGAVFTVGTNGAKFTNLYSFSTGDDGANPAAGLVLSGSALLGTASAGGNWNAGALFSLNTNKTGFTNFYVFDSTDGLEPLGGLLLSGDTLYGTSFEGGVSTNGVVFKIKTNGSAFFVLTNFPATDPATGTNNGGANPQGDLVLSGGTLFGTTTAGGTAGNGTVFALGTNGGGFNLLWDFPAADTNSFGLLTNADGVDPEAGLVLSGGVMFGTTFEGGGSGAGTVFTLGTNGSGFKVLWNFSGGDTNADNIWTNSDGANPEAGLVLSGTNLFGTTYYGGSNGSGTVFMIGTNGKGFAVLKTFSETDPDTGVNKDGANPYAGLLLSGGMLFGTAENGGVNGNGTVFALGTNGGGFNVLWEFSETNADTETNMDGANPDGALVLSGANLFGTTSAGGYWGGGTIFEISTNGGALANLRNFNYSTDGDSPYADLILSGNSLFGATSEGGVSGGGAIFDLDTTVTSPLLAINGAGAGVLISWPSPSAGFVLQQTTNLASADWVDFPGTVLDNGITNAAVIDPQAGDFYFRLYHP
jgi:uncharacterized repeat protein (TIGR03803 family)